jgi:hypothetical protein
MNRRHRLLKRFPYTLSTARSLKRALHAALQWVLKPYFLILAERYAPAKILMPADDTGVIFHRVVKDSPRSYVIADVPSGMLFTDRSHNVTVSQHQALIPFVSWQYAGFDDVVLDDEQNWFLTRKTLPLRRPSRFPGTVASLLTGGGSYNYYHWLFDALPRYCLIRDQLESPPNAYVTENSLHFQRESLKMLGLRDQEIISARRFPFIAADRLVATSHPNPNSESIPDWIVSFLRASFSGFRSERSFGPFVYISRRDATYRRLVNEHELLTHLSRLGVISYHLSELSFADQISLFASARIIIGIHGAGLANLVFAQKSAVVFELFSANYHPTIFPQISRRIGIRHESIHCDPSGSRENALQSDLRISAEKIAELTDLVRTCSDAP